MILPFLKIVFLLTIIHNMLGDWILDSENESDKKLNPLSWLLVLLEKLSHRLLKEQAAVPDSWGVTAGVEVELCHLGMNDRAGILRELDGAFCAL